MSEHTYSAVVRDFRLLHQSGCFIIPNPWDIGSARFLATLGFKALATSSAGFAFTRGKPDSVSALSIDDVIGHIEELVAATPLPINADFQSGYADDLDRLAENVARCCHTGAAGLSIEDATGDTHSPLYAHDVAIEQIRAARAAIDSTETGVLLTARCEAYLVGADNPERIVLDRLTAFADAGADCLFAPGVPDTKTVKELVKAVSPLPLNVLVPTAIPGFTLPQLADLGVRRLSLGSALARVAWGALIKSATAIAQSGEFDSLSDAASFSELNGIFR